ncbi:MAG: hypothetical protein ACXADY_10635 [Candidatus Hodarchaeales archaeon]
MVAHLALVLAILILTIITLSAISNGDSDDPGVCGGVFGLVSMPWIMWEGYDIQVEGLFVTTLPYVEPFFISTVHTTLWFMGFVVLLKRLEVN